MARFKFRDSQGSTMYSAGFVSAHTKTLNVVLRNRERVVGFEAFSDDCGGYWNMRLIIMDHP